MPNRRRLQSKLKALLDQYDEEIQAAFLEAIRSKKNGISLKELADAIESRDFNRALRIAGITRADLFPFDASINSAYVAGGQTVPAAAPSFAASFGFDGRADRAERWAREHVGGLVTRIVDEQREEIQSVIVEQLQVGRNPRQIAHRISGSVVNGRRQGGIIGLSAPQQEYLKNARFDLEGFNERYFTRKLRDRRYDSVVRRAIDTKTPLTNAQVERIAAAYSDRMLRHRAEVIARTESITALRAGRDEGVRQAIEQGAMENVTKEWDSTGDARTRPDHLKMDGDKAEMDKPFTAPDGSELMYPGDTSLNADASQTAMCRCVVFYTVDWLKA